MRYYFCTNCGLRFDLGRERERVGNCKDCDYPHISEMDQEEWDEDCKERPWIIEGLSVEQWFKREESQK